MVWGLPLVNLLRKHGEDHEFTSIEDLRKRTRLSNNHIDTLQKLGVLDSLNESDQLSLFDL